MSPPSGGSHSFEARATSLTPTIVTTSQPEPGRSPAISQVQMIGDELLVATARGADVQGFLNTNGIQFARLTSLLAGLKVPAALKTYDVEVWKLLPGYKPMTNFLPTLWSTTLANDQRAATPNHILIPAGWQDSCPYGPPEPSKSSTLRHPEGDHELSVTVIDAGYQWNWQVPNPLDRMAHITKKQGQHPKPAEQYQNALVPTRGDLGDLRETPFQADWIDDHNDVPDANHDKRLDALAGHGNFVIGVLAQYFNFPDVRLFNHFGGFYPDPDEYIRELSVCRSLIRSFTLHPKDPSPLINLGFSFVPLKQPGKDHVLSQAWDTVFRVLGKDPDKLLMLTPAGNQGSNVWHYPAALNTLYPGQYPNVWGVASHDPGKQTPSLNDKGKFWSNYGEWVKCSAIGSDVRSTFLHVKSPTEDDADKRHPVHDFTQNNLAIWSGTCFAAPKITGMLAAQYAVTNSLNQAWQNLVSTGGHIQNTNMGVVFQV
jgi:hypothetical protein